MSARPSARPHPFALEQLEAREVPAASLDEPFRQAAAGGLPGGWSQWSSTGSPLFQVAPGEAGFGDDGQLTSASDLSTASGRAWVTAPFGADAETSVAVYLNTIIPVHVFARGSDLGTTAPSYYAVEVTRGAEVELVRVVNGRSESLGKVRSDSYLSNQWVEITLRAEGDRLRAFLRRTDTDQYLTSGGAWSHVKAAAVDVRDGTITGGGQVGFDRPGAYAGTVAIDELSVRSVEPTPDGTSVPLVAERFDGPGDGVPAGWGEWNGPKQAFRTTADATLVNDGTGTDEARAWFGTTAAADVQVSASVFADGVIPAGVFARGAAVDTDRPSYYAATVTRGVAVTLWKVVDGVPTKLGTVLSKEWVSGRWVQVSLTVAGDQLSAQAYRADTGEYLNPDGTWGTAPAAAVTATDGAIASGGRVGLTRGSGYSGPVVFDNFVVSASANDPTTTPPPQDPPAVPPPVSPPISPPPAPASDTSLPPVPQHYDWIRLANLAYYGTPLDSFAQSLLRNSIDLVIPNTAYLSQINAVSPTTPMFAYTNVTNIYLGLLNDWSNYADRNGIDREAAYYHVTRPTGFNGSSASATPVDRFWSVQRGSDVAGWTDLSDNAYSSSGSFAFAPAGQAVAVGFLEKFREINVSLRSGAGNGWQSQLEYVAAVDVQGRPTLWKTLNLVSDGTNGLTGSGRVTFDPPKDWVPAAINGGRLFTVRFRTTAGGTAPVVTSLTGRDYAANNTIPAFDATADRDGDGYLSDSEYAGRRAGFDARFVHESRLFYPNYGEMRYATNLADPSFRAWAVDFHARQAAANPLVRGFFVDNSTGKLAVDPSGLAESLAGYAADHGSLLGAINAKLAQSGRWLIANTAGAGAAAGAVAENVVSYLEEFALRPLTANYTQFQELAGSIAYRRAASGGKAYEILDSLPTGGSQGDPRTQIATLAMYYLLADPQLTFLMVNGGNQPASNWREHWIEAATYDVGKPTENWSVVGTGTDPANAALAYQVFGRRFENALVLYKPLSYKSGVNGGTGNETATVQKLDGWYRPVNADGSLGVPVNQIRLRNGEGAVLAKVA